MYKSVLVCVGEKRERRVRVHFRQTKIQYVIKYELRNTVRAESKFRNSSPFSKNQKFWILDDVYRISEITELLTTFVNNLQRREIFSLLINTPSCR